MPPIFKALASIMVWILWLSGLVMGFSTFVLGIMAGHLFNPTEVMPMEYPASFAVALAFGIGAAARAGRARARRAGPMGRAGLLQ